MTFQKIALVLAAALLASAASAQTPIGAATGSRPSKDETVAKIEACVRDAAVIRTETEQTVARVLNARRLDANEKAAVERKAKTIKDQSRQLFQQLPKALEKVRGSSASDYASVTSVCTAKLMELGELRTAATQMLPPAAMPTAPHVK